MKRPIIFDVDGVLADFITGFTAIANSLYGTPIVSTLEQPSWDFSWCVTKEQQSDTWQVLRRDQRFWSTLQPLATEDEFRQINALASPVLFVTSRVSDVADPGVQTHLWLRNHGISTPNVVVTDRKGEIAKAVRAGFAIEDKLENAWAIHWLSDAPQTESFILDRPYNRGCDGFGPQRVKRITNLQEYLDVIK